MNISDLGTPSVCNMSPFLTSKKLLLIKELSVEGALSRLFQRYVSLDLLQSCFALISLLNFVFSSTKNLRDTGLSDAEPGKFPRWNGSDSSFIWDEEWVNKSHLVKFGMPSTRAMHSFNESTVRGGGISAMGMHPVIWSQAASRGLFDGMNLFPMYTQ